MHQFLLIIVTVALINNPILSNNITSNNPPVIVTGVKNYTSSSPQWVTSPYFRAGQELVISTLTGSNQSPFASYTFTYSSALPGVPNLAYGIQKYRGNDYLGQQYWQIRKTALTATTFSVQIQIFGVTNLWILAVAYLAVDPTFPHHLNSFDNIPINHTAGDIVNISSKSNELTYYYNYINYTAQAAGKQFTTFTSPLTGNYIVIYMTSFWVAGTFGDPLQFHVYPQVINSSHYLWNITVYRKASVTNVHFSEVIFNSDDVGSSQKYFIVFSKWYNDMEGGFLEVPIEFVDNFIMGATTFEVTDAGCGFEYQWQFVNKTVNGSDVFGVQLLRSWTINNKCGFTWSQSYLFYMMTWRCVEPYPYFNLTTGLCQTLCGGFYFQNTTTGTCQTCNNSKCYQCQNPNNTACTDCASYLFYEVGGDGCVCMAGYFQSNSSCGLCNSVNAGCFNCSYDDGSNGSLAYDAAWFSCDVCNTTGQYFLNGSLCQLCSLVNCLDCYNLTACALCDTGFDYSDGQTCIDCLVTGCYNCSAIDQHNCTICNQTAGYYHNLTTYQCDSLCGDGIWVSLTQSCDDNNTDNYDGCSDRCQIENGFICQGEPSVCYFTANASIEVVSQQMENQSVVCNTVTFGVRVVPDSGIFQQSYIQWQNFISTPNASILMENSSMLNYTGGVLYLSYFLLADLQNQSLIFETNFSTLLNNSFIFANTSSPPLQFTVNTSDPQAVVICCSGFFLNTTAMKCQEICGDGLLFQLSCDDGNVQNGDGCDSNCSVQVDYFCYNGSQTSTSICSYTGPVTMKVESALKDPKSNSMNITYSIAPIIPLLVLTDNSIDFTELVSYEGQITVKSAIIDVESGQLVVNLQYDQNLQDKDLLLRLRGSEVPQAKYFPEHTFKWQVSATNQLSVSVYSQSQYKQLQSIEIALTILQYIFIAIVLFTLLFRKFIGLQLATFIQLSYLSLLMNPAITVYLYPLTTLHYLFGYNQLFLSPEPTTRMESSYYLYRYQPYSGYSFNLMCIIISLLYGLAVVLVILSALISGVYARKIKNIAFVVSNDLCYALVVFSTPNILTTLCIQIQQGTITDRSYSWSKMALVGGLLMLVMAHFINLAFVEKNSDVGPFLRRQSKVAVYMPAIFNFRLIVFTLLIFIYNISPEIPAYLLIILQFSYIAYVIGGHPHKRAFDTVRATILELGLLYVLVMRYLEIDVFAENVSPQSQLYPGIAYTEYGFYVVAMGLSIAAVGYHLFKKFRNGQEQENAVKKQRVEQKSQEAAENIDNEIVENEHEQPVIINDSMHKLEIIQSKRKLDDKPYFFDLDNLDNVQDIQIEQAFAPANSKPRRRGRKARTRNANKQ